MSRQPYGKVLSALFYIYIGAMLLATGVWWFAPLLDLDK